MPEGGVAWIPTTNDARALQRREGRVVLLIELTRVLWLACSPHEAVWRQEVQWSA